ncbi:MAG TPA: ANTAR domain-containing protein [Acidimicrobiales bacterium]
MALPSTRPPDLWAAATLGELVAMATRTLARAGADMATGWVVHPKGLVLTAHVGVDRGFAEHFAVVTHPTWTTPALDRVGPDHVADLAAHPLLDRTPDRDVLLGAGARSATSAAVPAPAGDEPVAVVSVLHRDPGPDGGWTDRVTELAAALRQQLATLATVDDPAQDALTAAVLEAAQLRYALERRTLIGTAKGILMGSMGVGGDEAMAVLKRASKRENVKVRDIAARIVARHERERRHRRAGRP